ncbi:MAG: putative transporter [Alphaproteobacteria bacterium]|nr:putative transporter [Alphaproteobacteria bacterium]
MFKSFYMSREWRVWAWGGLLVIVTLLAVNVRILVFLNEWYRDFYDIIQKPENHSMTDFWNQIRVFAYVVFPYIAIVTFANWFNKIYVLRWRQAINYAYIPLWREVDAEIEGSSQRIQEDTYRFGRIVERLFSDVMKALFTLIGFIPILWMLSKEVSLPIVGVLPGSLVWVALFISIGGLVISWFVSWKLPGLEYNNQKVEAAYRKELVYGEDNKKDYAAQPKLFELFAGIRFNHQQLFLHTAYYDLWYIFFSQTVILLPLVLIAPALFAGTITLGVLFQINNAFDKVYDSFAVILDNWIVITELRSIFKRLREFESNLPQRK